MSANNIVIRDAKIMFRNFSGVAGKFTAEGVRHFCVCIDDDIAQKLMDEGWNIRRLKPVEESDHQQAYLQVRVAFDRKPPKVVLVTGMGQKKTILGEDEVKLLDFADLEKVDLVLTPYHWELNDKKGVKAYLKSLYATIVEDELEMEYYGEGNAALDAIGGCGNCEECDGTCEH